MEVWQSLAECTGLENQQGFAPLVGSNPTASAKLSMANSKLRVRFAPSPTGQLHLGGARTALFNWLFAKHHNGSFLVRIEDTDTLRSKDEFTHQICQSMKWLGLDWDDELIFQSKRTELYLAAIQSLLESGQAYRCFATKDELDSYRSMDGSFFYPEIWRNRSENDIQSELDKNSPFTIRLKTPKEGIISFSDEIYGSIKVDNSEIDDFIIARSDGSPVYNLVVVVDDNDMKISHVIRGEDHVANTLKQIYIYDALDYTIPVFAHLPMILGPDKKRLSKRHGATGVQAYQALGFTSDALLNHLALLGWNPGTEQDIFSVQDLIKQFDIKRVQKKSAVFDIQKLHWISAQHIMALSSNSIYDSIKQLNPSWGDSYDKPFLLSVIELLKQRSKTIVDFIHTSHYFFSSPTQFDKKAMRKSWKPETTTSIIELLIIELNTVLEWNSASIEKSIKNYAEKNEISLGKIIQPTRLAISGASGGPSLFSIMELIGKNVCISRLNYAITHFPIIESDKNGS